MTSLALRFAMWCESIHPLLLLVFLGTLVTVLHAIDPILKRREALLLRRERWPL